MEARITKKMYSLSVDCVMDTQGRVWQARDVARDNNGEIDLMLDTSPYEERIYCYSIGAIWEAYNAKGAKLPSIDPVVLEYLKEVRKAIPGRPEFVVLP